MQIILFTNKDETPAVFRALAQNGQELGFAFADVHESEETLMKEFNVKKVRRAHHSRVYYAQEQGPDKEQAHHQFSSCTGCWRH